MMMNSGPLWCFCAIFLRRPARACRIYTPIDKREAMNAIEGTGERQQGSRLAFAVGFFFSCRIIIVLLSVRVLGTTPSAGAGLGLLIDLLLLACGLFSFGRICSSHVRFHAAAVDYSLGSGFPWFFVVQLGMERHSVPANVGCLLGRASHRCGHRCSCCFAPAP